MIDAANDPTDPAIFEGAGDAAAIGAALLLADLHEAVAEATSQLVTLAAATAPAAAPLPPHATLPVAPAVPEPFTAATAPLLPPELVVLHAPSVIPDAKLREPLALGQDPVPSTRSEAPSDQTAMAPQFVGTASATSAVPLPSLPQTTAPPSMVAAARGVRAGWQGPSAEQDGYAFAPSQGSEARLPRALATDTQPLLPRPAAPGTSGFSDMWSGAIATPAAPGPSPWPAPGVAGADATLPPASLMASAAPPARQGSGPTGGDVFLDGVRVGRWLSDTLAREVGGPATGGTGFDPRLGPTWPGALQGNG